MNLKLTPLTDQPRMERFDGSNYSAMFYAPFWENGKLSIYTNQRIANSPMFHPFSASAVVATPTDGIVPVGLVMMK